MKKSRVGVFICHCGHNIARAIDVKSVMEKIVKYPGVAHVEDSVYLCSDPGQKIVTDKIKEAELKRRKEEEKKKKKEKSDTTTL